MTCLRPDIGDQNRVAVTANRVFEHVSQLRLAIGHVITLLVGRSNDDLLEEGQGTVDVAGFAHCDASCASLFGSLVAGKINKMEL